MPLTKKVKNSIQPIRGIVTVRNFLIPDTPEAHRLDEFLKTSVNVNTKKYRAAVKALGELCETKEHVFFNQVHRVGREVFARMLVGDSTYTGEINYGALGSGSAAIVDTDTTLGTEVARKPIASRSRTNDSVTIDFYYSKSDTDGTYEEFACFIDGSAAADSGQMFNRVLTGGWSKSATEAMTVSVQFDLQPA